MSVKVQEHAQVNQAQVNLNAPAAQDAPLVLAEPLDDKSKLGQALARRGVDEFVWRALCNSIYPGAQVESVLMVIDYCRAKELNPLKKPCHIVPMEVYVKKADTYEWRDVVMPGVYEYRTVAHRTGEYLGHTAPEYGPLVEEAGIKAPAWCRMVFQRWNKSAQREMLFPITLYFAETVAVTKDKGTGEWVANKRWRRSPIQMLTKCVEAAGLREAFPEDLGGTHTDDELAGRTLNAEDIEIATPRGKPHAEEPRARADAPVTTHTQVPLAQLRKLIDEIGIPENEFCANFELGALEELALKDVPAAFTFLNTLRPTPP